MNITNKSQVINGVVTISDWVVAIYDNQLGCLVGMVSDIDKYGTPEHKSESDTDDIHLDFTVFSYPDERVLEIADYFNIPFNEADGFDGYPIGNVVMAPDKIFSVMGWNNDEIIRFCKQFEEQHGIIRDFDSLDTDVGSLVKGSDSYPCCLHETPRTLDWCEENCECYYSCDTVACAGSESNEDNRPAVDTGKVAAFSEFERLLSHVGHRVEIVVYGENQNVSAECMDCCEVLHSVDNPIC